MNTWPLVWGFLHGPQKGLYDFRFDLPAQCAAAVELGDVDVGLVPSAELNRLGLRFFPGLGIAADAEVRSILLISRTPFSDITTLAADSSSRTSVALCRILLKERYGCLPQITRESPNLAEMLDHSDAALIIGDPALRIDVTDLPFHVMDLGAEWAAWSGLPMVFAVWAGRARVDATAFLESYEWGRGRIEEMVSCAALERGFRAPLAREYLTRNIVYELGPKHLAGLQLFRQLAGALPLLPDRVGV